MAKISKTVKDGNHFAVTLLNSTPCVETVAVMAKYNPFFEKAGMQRIAESKPSIHMALALRQLEVLGFDLALMAGTSYNEQKLKEIGIAPIVEVLVELSRHDESIRRRLSNLKNIYPLQK